MALNYCQLRHNQIIKFAFGRTPFRDAQRKGSKLNYMAVYENITKREHIYLDKYGKQHSTLQEALAADKRDSNTGMAERTGGEKNLQGENEKIKE